MASVPGDDAGELLSEPAAGAGVFVVSAALDDGASLEGMPSVVDVRRSDIQAPPLVVTKG